jgi:Sortase and related acyltransferases
MYIAIIKLEDTPEVLEIYKPYILSSATTFELEVTDIEQFALRAQKYSQQFPWLVAKDGDTIAGYAYAWTYRERAAYQWIVETSIYINKNYKKKGIGSTLYEVLFEILKLQQVHKAYALITLPNAASVGFHEKQGFRHFATFEKVGHKHGAWHDVGWWEKTLIEQTDTSPLPIIPFKELDATTVNTLLSKYAI